MQVIREVKEVVPVFVMFTLSPYNDFDDLRHVARVCKENGVFLRVGIYDNIPFFDTIEDAPGSAFGQYKNDEVLTYSKAKELKENKGVVAEGAVPAEVVVPARMVGDYTALIPEEVREYGENYRLCSVVPEMGFRKIAVGLSFDYG